MIEINLFNDGNCDNKCDVMSLKSSFSTISIAIVTAIFIIEQINFNCFDDIFALKWLISIISMHSVIEKVEFNGAQL